MEKIVQRTLPVEKPIIFVDNRELQSGVLNHLKRFDVIIKTKNLEVSDYICSERVAVEKKTIRDFLSSIIDQRIFRQLNDLSQSYERPVLLIEGNPELLYSETNIHPNSIKGALAHIAIDSRMPIIWTMNARDTADFIYRIAFREQVAEKKPISIRSVKRNETISDIQEYLVASLPNVNSMLTRRLLKKFKTPKRIFSASKEQLQKIDGIGEKKAKKIWDTLNKIYKP